MCFAHLFFSLYSSSFASTVLHTKIPHTICSRANANQTSRFQCICWHTRKTQLCIWLWALIHLNRYHALVVSLAPIVATATVVYCYCCATTVLCMTMKCDTVLLQRKHLQSWRFFLALSRPSASALFLYYSTKMTCGLEMSILIRATLVNVHSVCMYLYGYFVAKSFSVVNQAMNESHVAHFKTYSDICCLSTLNDKNA